MEQGVPEGNDSQLLVHCEAGLLASSLVGLCVGLEPVVEAHVGTLLSAMSQLLIDGKDIGIIPKSVQASLDKNRYGTENDT